MTEIFIVSTSPKVMLSGFGEVETNTWVHIPDVKLSKVERHIGPIDLAQTETFLVRTDNDNAPVEMDNTDANLETESE